MHCSKRRRGSARQRQCAREARTNVSFLRLKETLAQIYGSSAASWRPRYVLERRVRPQQHCCLLSSSASSQRPCYGCMYVAPPLGQHFRQVWGTPATAENTPRGGVNRCMANLMINDAELKTNCNTLSVTKECSRIPGDGF